VKGWGVKASPKTAVGVSTMPGLAHALDFR
jgi:hypothetical protein